MEGDRRSWQRSNKDRDPEGEMSLACSRKSKKTQFSGKRLVGDEPRPLGMPRSHKPCWSQQGAQILS